MFAACDHVISTVTLTVVVSFATFMRTREARIKTCKSDIPIGAAETLVFLLSCHTYAYSCVPAVCICIVDSSRTL